MIEVQVRAASDRDLEPTGDVGVAPATVTLSAHDLAWYSQGLPAWLPQAAARLRELAQWSENWDGYGALSVSGDAIRVAFSLLRASHWAEVPSPDISGSPDGGVIIDWDTQAIELRFDVSADGRHVDLYIGGEMYSHEWEGPLGQEPDGIEKLAWRLAQTA